MDFLSDLPELLDEMAPLPEGMWKRLADNAQVEPWRDSNGKYGVLVNLIKQHFRRLRQQGGLVRTKDGQIFMNSSLRSRQSKVDIILAFLPDTTPDGSKGRKPYGPPQVMFAGDKELQGMVIPLANWFNGSLERSWDSSLPFNYNVDHIIIDRQDRLPGELLKMNLGIVKGALHGAIDEAVEQVKRDDSIALPFVFIPKGIFQPVIQWLLPLYFSADTGASAVLVVERLQHGYRAATILTPEMAYRNARVIRSFAKPWLIPDSSPEVKEDVLIEAGESSRTEPKPQKICAFIATKAGCSKGEQCRFSHHIRGEPANVPEPVLPHTPQRRPCPRFTKDGYCNFGSKCWYSHDL